MKRRLSGSKNLPTSNDDPRLQGWYHTIELGNGLISKGIFDHRSVVDLFGIPKSLEGMRVLDVATADGFFAFEMERRGAAEVVAIDVNRLAECDWVPRMVRPDMASIREAQDWKNRFQIAHALLDSAVERVHCSVYDLSPDIVGTFDLVFCGDLLLHLQCPLQALHGIRSVTKGSAIIETPYDHQLETAFPDEPYLRFGSRHVETDLGSTNTFWLMNTRALEDMMLYADFASVGPFGKFVVPPGLAVTAVIGRTE